MAHICLLAQAKRLFGFIGVGGTLGALAGSMIATLLAKPMGSTNLIFISIILLEIAFFSVRRLVVIHRIDAIRSNQTSVPSGALHTSDLWLRLNLIALPSHLRWFPPYTFL